MAVEIFARSCLETIAGGCRREGGEGGSGRGVRLTLPYDNGRSGRWEFKIIAQNVHECVFVHAMGMGAIIINGIGSWSAREV